MTVAASVALTEEQRACAASLLEAGELPSAEAVVGRGFAFSREDAERRMYHGMILEEFRPFLDERREGPFISMEEPERRMEEMFARKRREHGLPD